MNASARVIGFMVLILGTLAPPASAQQAPLEAIAAAVAGYWSQGDADGLARVLSPAGVSLHLVDQSHPAAGVRQARAALADLLGGGGIARVVEVEMLGGVPERGFAELDWKVGGNVPESRRFVVFLGFVREGESWKIAEIRVLR